jgi:hypothetical protein
MHRGYGEIRQTVQVSALKKASVFHVLKIIAMIEWARALVIEILAAQ